MAKKKGEAMDETANVFKKNYEDYCTQIEKVDFEPIKQTLGIKSRKDGYLIPFFDEEIQIRDHKILDLSGKRPDYIVSVIIAKYILLSPEKLTINDGWASLKDFKKGANFISTGAFSADTERSIAEHFSGRLSELKKACEKSGGLPHELGTSYDLAMTFNALPRISILLLYNDSDEEFPAKCTLLFQKHAEYYLDPESLIMTIGFLFKMLKIKDRENAAPEARP
jgi:Domain of unknown function (DUF3786)